MYANVKKQKGLKYRNGLSLNICLKFRLCNSMSSHLTAKTESSHNFGTKNLRNCGTEVVHLMTESQNILVRSHKINQKVYLGPD